MYVWYVAYSCFIISGLHFFLLDNWLQDSGEARSELLLLIVCWKINGLVRLWLLNSFLDFLFIFSSHTSPSQPIDTYNLLLVLYTYETLWIGFTQFYLYSLIGLVLWFCILYLKYFLSTFLQLTFEFVFESVGTVSVVICVWLCIWQRLDLWWPMGPISWQHYCKWLLSFMPADQKILILINISLSVDWICLWWLPHAVSH